MRHGWTLPSGPEDLEVLLARINGSVEPRALAGREPVLPMVLVVGSPRSGTTLLMQWLASSGSFAYPSNLVSRLYNAPDLGADLERLLTDESLPWHQETLVCSRSEWTSSFESRYGKTEGLLEPHGFWNFWRRFLPLEESAPLAPGARASVDLVGLRTALGAWEGAAGLPLAMKGLLVQFELSLIMSALPRTVVIHVVRDPASTASSLLAARRELLGGEARWYSVRPPGWHSVLCEEPELQVAWQVEATRREIARALRAYPGRHLTWSFEEFCSNPRSHWRAMAECLEVQGFDIRGPKELPSRFVRPRRPGSFAPSGTPWDTRLDEARTMLERGGSAEEYVRQS